VLRLRSATPPARASLAALAIALVIAGALAAPRPLRAADEAPGFRVALLDAPGEFDTRDLIGKRVLVLRFQASYCKPCGRESGALNRVAARYRERGVEVLALHVQDTVADTRRFIKRHQVRYPVALDPQLTIGNRYGFKGTPYTVVVDRRGEIVARIHGVSAVARLPRILDAALAADPTRKL